MDINPTGSATTANAIGNATTLNGTSRVYASCTSASTVFIAVSNTPLRAHET